MGVCQRKQVRKEKRNKKNDLINLNKYQNEEIKQIYERLFLAFGHWVIRHFLEIRLIRVIRNFHNPLIHKLEAYDTLPCKLKELFRVLMLNPAA